jgi:predicted DNA-binding ribbon-helix-helix protein
MCRQDALMVLPKTAMRSITKRSVVIAGHKTSVSLEDAFWSALKEVAAQRDMTLSELVGAIDADREHGNLSSAIRLFVLDVYLDQLDRILVAKKDSKRPRGVAR